MTVRKSDVPQVWRLEEAKARFSQVVDQAKAGQAQIVTRRGEEAAVVVGIEQWKALNGLEMNGLELFGDVPIIPEFEAVRENGPLVERDLSIDWDEIAQE